MKPPTEAQLETMDRQCHANMERIKKSLVEFGKCKGLLQQQWNNLKATQKAERPDTKAKRFEMAGDFGEKASKHFFTALGYLRNPELPGVEAEELARRDFASQSVATAPGPHMIGFLEGEGREARNERNALARRRNGSLESIFGEMSRRMTVEGILERLPEAGWTEKDTSELMASMLKQARESNSLVKMQAAVRTLQDFIKIIQPKIVVDNTRSIEDMTEDETREAIQLLANELGIE